MTEEDRGSDDHERRSVLKALGIGGLAAAGVGASAGSAAAAPQQQQQGGTTELTGELSGVELPSAAADSTAGTFESGTLSIDSLEIDRRTGELLAGGTIDGVLQSGQEVTQSFSRTAAGLDSDDACTILTLDLGPLDLEVLGLRVQLSEVNLDITGQTGAGNLLGNLLCAIADIGSGGLSNLLDPVISSLNNLLNQLLG